MRRNKTLSVRILLWLAITLTISGLSAPDISRAQQQHKFTQPLKTSPDPQGPIDQSTLAAIGTSIKSLTGSGNSASKAASTPVISIFGKGQSVYRDEHNATPVFLSGQAVTTMNKSMGKIAAGSTAADIAMMFISANSDFFSLESPADELVIKSQTVSSDGRKHVQFDQYYHGIPYWDKRLVVHLDSDGEPYAFNARYSPTPVRIDTGDVSLSRAQAIEAAVADLSVKTVIGELDDFSKKAYGYSGPAAGLVIMDNPADQKPVLTWHVVIRPNIREHWNYFIDARTGECIESYSDTTDLTPVDASGVDALGATRLLHVARDNIIYYMTDTAAKIDTYDAQGKVLNQSHGAVIVSSKDNTWKDAISVSAHSNARTVYDYYAATYNRHGLDDNNFELPVVVHYTEDGTQLYNAFWSGQFIAFGDGDIFAAALDVVAHELTHAVVDFTVGLDYRYQPGALNEGIADAMASVVDPDWEMGEDLNTGPLRDLENPSKYGLPSSMAQYRTMPLSEDNGGVHYNMSIPSLAFVYVVNQIGRDKAAEIWYDVLNKGYLAPQSQFVDMRLGAVQAATDLYGADSAEMAAVKSAFDTVGIVDQPPTEQPTDTPAPTGEQWVVFVYNNYLFLAPTTIQSDNDITLTTRSRVSDSTGSPIAVSSDGSFLLFIDTFNNIRYLDLETFQETLIDNTRKWSSLALSPDNIHLALTTIYQDKSINIIDLDTPANSKAVTLYTPSTEGVETNTAMYADALDWDRTGKNLLYDSFHQLPVEGGSPIEFWDVNLLDVDSEIITRVKTPTEHDIQVGNPSFAETNDSYIVCDLFSEELKINRMVAVDLFNLEISVLRENGMVEDSIPNLSFPKYSPDDTAVLFQHYEEASNTYYLYKLPLKDDKMTPAGTEELYYEGELPRWFVKGGTAPTPVETQDTAPEPVVLYQNSPNPFNPGTSILYTITEPGQVVLTVYDILGRKVETLVDGYQPAGTYRAAFDGSTVASGIYLYRLDVGAVSRQRKMMLVK